MRDYESPRIEVLGSIAELTQQNVQGSFTDATFPAGTHRGDLTFSF